MLNCCPRHCIANREKSEGFCGTSHSIIINTAQLHYHEEPVISGTKGSGTVFFSGCNMRCVYCQNYKISHIIKGTEYKIKDFANILLELERKKAQNINLVSPMHFSKNILEGLKIARSEGLSIPVIWNSNGYENPEILKTLEGFVDIFLPDFKYADNTFSQKYSGINDYPEVVKKAISEMYRQVGHLKVYDGLAYRGLMIRLLVLPENINGIEYTLDWIAENLGIKTHISLMGQYYPTALAMKYPEINRSISKEEYLYAVSIMEQFGFENGYLQDIGSSSYYTPDFYT